MKDLNQISKSEMQGLASDPKHDWKIIFFTAAILCLITIGLNAFIFTKIDKGEIFVIDEASQGGEVILDADQLRTTVEYYQNKESRFEEIINGNAPIRSVDPSL